MPLLLWWAIEAKAGTDPEAVLAMFEDRSIWASDRAWHRDGAPDATVRRGGHAGRPGSLHAAAGDGAGEPEDAKRLMAGFEAAYAGRSLAGLPTELAEAVAKYAGQSLTIGLRQGKPEAIAEAVQAPGRRPCRPQQAAPGPPGPGRGPPAGRPAGRAAACLPLARQCPPRRRAAALAAYDDPAIAAEVLAAYPNMSDDVQSAAQGLLATRRTWAARFVEAIEARSIDAQTVPREVVEKLVVLGDPQLTERVSRLFGPRPAVDSGELRAEVDRLAAVVRSGSGVPKPGKQLFDRTCALPHALLAGAARSAPT